MLYTLYFLFQARFLLSRVNPSQTHNTAFGWGQVGYTNITLVHLILPYLIYYNEFILTKHILHTNYNFMHKYSQHSYLLALS